MRTARPLHPAARATGVVLLVAAAHFACAFASLQLATVENASPVWVPAGVDVDHLERHRAACAVHGVDVGLHVVGAAALQRADVDHHVDLAGARGDRGGGFKCLGGRQPGTERKADYRTDEHAGIGQLARGERHVRRIHADRVKAMLGRLAAEFADLRVARVGREQRVIDGLSELGVGKRHVSGLHGACAGRAHVKLMFSHRFVTNTTFRPGPRARHDERRLRRARRILAWKRRKANGSRH